MAELDDLNRDLGRLEGDVSAMKDAQAEAHARFSGQLAALDAKVSNIHDVVMKANGGLRMLLLVGSICAALSAFITSLIQTWRSN